MALSHNPSLVTEGLIIYLDANNTSSYAGTGTTWYDLSGNGRHASLISSPSYEGFGGGKYLSFDGSTNYATIPYTITDNLITVSFWYYSKIFSANSSLDALISNYTSGISGFDVRLNSSTTINLAIVIAAGESQINIGTITNNTWYNVAFTYDGATVKTYLDGVFKSSANVVGTRANGTQICIGTSAFDTNRRATCGVPQVMIYNRALSDAEILRNYNATKKRYFPEENIVRDGLVFNLDAGNTRCYAGTGNTAYDISGTGTTATLLNGLGYSNAYGGSFSFDGTDDYITLPSSNNWALGTTATIEMWVYAILTNTNARLYCVNNNTTNIDAYINSVGTLGFHGAASNVNNFPMSQWVHLVVVYNSGNFSVYFNGVSKTVNGTTSYNITGTGTLYIGQYAGGGSYYHKGNISNFRIYKGKALSSTEILQNYNALKNRYGLS